MTTTIAVQTNSFSEAKEVLKKVYNVDKSATYCNGQKSVSGSSLTATIEWENLVKISSGCYTEASLKEMFE